MFTGIVTSQGRLLDRKPIGGDVRLRFDSGGLSLDGCGPGDSICVSGACLTMLDLSATAFSADVSPETLAVTTLGQLREGDPVNLELAMRPDHRLGGHLVTGHVDGIGSLRSRQADARAERLEFEVPDSLARYLARKGSVCVDGVSLTVNEVEDARFSVCLIPHTLEVTTLGRLQPGDQVNIEVDLVARYLERLAQPFLQPDARHDGSSGDHEND